jgi:hypothetical protein
MTPRVIFVRACRELARRRAIYCGVKYVDSMARDAIVIRQVHADLGLPFREDLGLEQRRATYNQAGARISPRSFT